MDNSLPCVLITGAADRIGAVMARTFHQLGYNVAIHYRSSHPKAAALAQQLEQQRQDSTLLLQCELSDIGALQQLPTKVYQQFGRLDIVINNASAFYPTPMENASEEQWQALMDANLKGPFFLAQAARQYLDDQRGSIINLVDIYAQRPLAEHPIYCIAKAGNEAMVKSLALELGPHIRVNGISPGAIMWPAIEATPQEKQRQAKIIEKTALKRCGKAQDIAHTAVYLATNEYISGQIISIDGGRTLAC